MLELIRRIAIAIALHLLAWSAVAQDCRNQNPKLSPRFFERIGSSHFMCHLIAEDTSDFQHWVAQAFPQAVAEPVPGLRKVFAVSGLDKGQLVALTQSTRVRFIEPASRQPSSESLIPGLDLTLNAVTTTHHFYPALTGEKFRVSIKENAFDKDDLDLSGRVVGYEAMPDSYDPHATEMATIVAGAGNTSIESKGVAWKSHVSYSDFNNLMPDNSMNLARDRIAVQNHSYGVGVENYYGIESYAYDQQCIQYDELVHVFSSGNAGAAAANSGIFEGLKGFANLTGQFKLSKNSIVVGAVDEKGVIQSQSSRGPAHDGRVKPELVAYGKGGTSEAAAIVSGICLIGQQLYKNINGVLPPSALIRAALINSADEGGTPHVDYVYGFGKVDALGMVRTIERGRYFSGVVSQGETKSFSIEVPPGIHQLKVTSAWNDRPGEPGTNAALVNDLDLQVVQNSSSGIFEPWVLDPYPHVDSLMKQARRGEDHLNNVEQVTIPEPREGIYAINVHGFNIAEGEQAFSIAYEFSSGMQWLFPAGSDAVEADRNIFLRWRWEMPDALGAIEWRKMGGLSWQLVGEVDLSTEWFLWRVPDVNEIIELRVRTGGNVIAAENFVVTQKPKVALGYDCQDDALLLWNSLPAPAFQVYALNTEFFNPLNQVLGDTVFQIKKDPESAPYFAVAPLIAGRPGVRSNVFALSSGSHRCYINSFLPREIVTDTVIVDLVLGTTVGLQSLVLERESPAGFVSITSLQPVENNSYALVDQDPRQGKNRYRIKLTRSNGETVYSQTEEVWYADKDDLVIFPNPAVVGDMISMITENDPVTMRIYHAGGTLARIAVEDGEIKMIDTSGMSQGLYFLHITTANGRELVGKIILR